MRDQLIIDGKPFSLSALKSLLGVVCRKRTTATAESLFRQNLNRELAEVKRLEEEGERALVGEGETREGVMERGEEWSAAKISFWGT